MKPLINTAFASLLLIAPANADPIKIVSWNMAPRLLEGLEARASDIATMKAQLSPDVVVLMEVAGEHEVKRIAEFLGWDEYYGAVTNWSTMINQVNFAIETAVISKLPIERVIEYDASVDGFHQPFKSEGASGATADITEERLSADGISGIDPLAGSDRGTMRVDLSNGLTIFPVHLKSNLNSACSLVGETIDGMEKLGLTVPAELTSFQARGFPAATDDHRRNALKRERVIAATKRLADAAVDEGRPVLIAGDFNTSLEPGKAGSVLYDCTLTAFSCKPGPFPASACTGGDGFDDTLAILTMPLVGQRSWALLSKELPGTYDDPVFSDLAIDHMAVPASQAARFTGISRARDVYGSDHFPIQVIFE